MKTLIITIPLVAFTLSGCVNEPSFRLDRLATHKTSYVSQNVYREPYMEDLLCVSDETKHIYSLICFTNTIYLRERDSRGGLLAQNKAADEFFIWYPGEQTGDYEPTKRNLVYINNSGDLMLYKLSTGETRNLWRGWKDKDGRDRTHHVLIRFVDSDHVLLVCTKLSDGDPRVTPMNPVKVMLISLAGEEKDIMALEGLNREFRLNSTGRLYFISEFYGEHSGPCLGFVDLFENPPVPKRFLKLPERGLFSFDVSPNGKKAAILMWGVISEKGLRTTTRLIEFDMSDGQSRDITTFAKDDENKSVYTHVRYLNQTKVAVNISPENFWNWSGNNIIRIYDVKSGKNLRQFSDYNLQLQGVIHDGDEIILVSEVQ